ncbi:MAG: hypothetical protein QNJ75_12925 [Acidimicrobiia bacterium]|nr:hypothetical protein [Acidimicrobiia bacterium]
MVATFILLGSLLAACSDGSDGGAEATLASSTTTTAASSTTTAVEGQIAETEGDLVYGTWVEATLAEEATLTLDMRVPDNASGAPIVVHLPGLGGGYATTPPKMVEGLVEGGAIVFIAEYALVDRVSSAVLPDPSDHGANIRAMAESAACAIRFARARAAELGSDDPVVVLSGFSGGGGVATHTALFGAALDASWDAYSAEGGPPRQVECQVADGSTHVDVLVGVAGPYDQFVPAYDGKYGRAYQQERDAAQWEFLSSAIGANPELKIRLLHGDSDSSPPYENSEEFAAVLSDAGYDVELEAFEGGHWIPFDLIVPTIMEAIGR